MEVMQAVLRAVLGMSILLAICYALSTNRRRVDWRLVLGGIALQLILAVLILKVPVVYTVFQWIADRFVDLLAFSETGAAFIFGSWPDEAWIEAMDTSGESPVKVAFQVGYIFAFRALPVIVFFAAFTAILYYFGILQRLIKLFAWLMSRFMHLSGAESIAAAANIFVGQTEAPLVIKPYLEKLTRSEVMCLMTGGMATIAGSVFAIYVSLIGEEYAVHFLTASIISAPAAIVAAKIMVPEADPSAVNTDVSVPRSKLGVNVLDAVTIGTTDGVRLAVNVGAMLMVFIAMVAMVNALLLWIGGLIGVNEWITESTNGLFAGLSMEYMSGVLFAPLAWLMGTPSDEVLQVGQLLGKKTVLNELIAYVDLGAYQASESPLSPKAAIISTYALCGFANFSSIGILIGGISAIAPGLRPVLTELGLRALAAPFTFHRDITFRKLDEGGGRGSDERRWNGRKERERERERP